MVERFVYSASALQRRSPEGDKGAQLPHSSGEVRSAFERDRARVLHSAALRRLADKTQVVAPMEGDTPRTRLTHSLEVAQISRAIGSGLGLDADLTELAGLSHDIGHPPYGHNGEVALNELASDCGGFEGNAQTLRILSRLELKTLADGDSYGLNLTRAALDAACKYPWGRMAPDGSVRRKYCAYDDDVAVLEWIRAEAPAEDPLRKCMEAQVMDASDDVAYSVHDVEDAIVSGRLQLSVLWDLVELATLAEKGAKAFGGNPDDMMEAASRLRELPLVGAVADYQGTFEQAVALKSLTSQLVGRFVAAIIGATREVYTGPLGRYTGNLIMPDEVAAEVTLLKTAAVLYVMDDERHQMNQQRQRDRMYRVHEYVTQGAPGTLDPIFAHWFNEATTDQQRQRVVIDQLASMTESRLTRLDKQAAAVSAAWG